MGTPPVGARGQDPSLDLRGLLRVIFHHLPIAGSAISAVVQPATHDLPFIEVNHGRSKEIHYNSVGVLRACGHGGIIFNCANLKENSNIQSSKKESKRYL